jgi:signal transduction histidine kinase
MARVETQLNLKRLTELKDEFLSIASHDLKNPLMGILGYASLVEQKILPGESMTEDAHGFVTKIVRLSRLIQRIIEDFLDFQALEDGEMKSVMNPTSLNEISELVLDNNNQYARSKNIEVTLELSPDLPQINADPTRIQQVVENLVSNAIKFSDEGSKVVVRTRAEQNELILEVCDTGPGLTDDDMQKLFKKYARLSSEPTGGEKSSGLGLAICKKIISMHRGTINARNNQDEGATFWFTLPLK